MKTFLITLLLSIFSLSPAYAENTHVAQIETFFREAKTLQAQFIQTTKVNILDRNIQRSGSIYLKQGGKLRIQYKKPYQKIYLSNGKYLWVLEPGNKSALNYSLAEGTLPKEALSFLNGLGNLRKEFQILKEEKNDETIFLSLKPKRKNAGYKQLDFLFEKDHFVQTLTIHNDSGNTSVYQFSQWKKNGLLSDHFFEHPVNTSESQR
ncbi:MAG: hypothetical protein COX62_03170 [Deltaproteobacteria bacterium CG_4_10_14_0_2_um_filter_43_8]|nr:MAG: hypothetical protein COV43_05635 [Deltaproteobacteria bacterium CG11_big_fil_rev_8_21_14_0_20_42_23]PJA21142.1 MAG: hypothetical protein COX62_03170 [Deltaproteobacteria bacterium CG_4_10_14_0_2_um_filter_43_8]PJC65260.1 MAG: hypothetical protein CO021_00010 [Deltaproteobacteria bacterium CG_4_9_14_0_2_um_filter_42_21]